MDWHKNATHVLPQMRLQNDDAPASLLPRGVYVAFRFDRMP